MGHRSKLHALLIAGALLGSLAPALSARATYSIIAYDMQSGQVGGAGTSCVGSFSVYTIYGVAPGVGVVAAQASVNTQARDRAVMLLEDGQAAAQIIADITGASFDPFSGVRQYAVIDVATASAAGFTGASTMAFADDVQGNAAPYVYSVQGNILTSAAVLEQARAVFTAPGCDLADTLMLAIEAGAQNSEGDSRCTPDGIPSDAAFIEVNLADQGTAEPFLHLEVVDTSPNNPLIELRAMYDGWRATHPCPESMVEPDAGATPDAGAPDAGTIGNPEPPQGGVMAPPPAGSGGAGGTAGVSAGVGGTGTGGMATPMQPLPPVQPQPQADSDSSGCTIARAEQASDHAGWLLAIAGALAFRRCRTRAQRRASGRARAL